MEATKTLQNEIVEFVRTRSYILLRELGQGSCGKTVLLHDDLIEEDLVCKKYLPHSESERQTLFNNFVREIKLLHHIHHPNVVRVFNYYLYPDKLVGYILMEFVDGLNIEEFLIKSPELVNELFLHAIEGFSYLESCGILHRDIRPGNLLVTKSGLLKIIDLGFGKQVSQPADFDKSITLNWWCARPSEFMQNRYDFTSEVYFVGKLFERLIQENKINHFKYLDVLRGMCVHDHEFRTQSFAAVSKGVLTDESFELDFSEEQIDVYRTFANAIFRQIKKIENGTAYIADRQKVQSQLSDVYRRIMLEHLVPDAGTVISCLVSGTYFYRAGGLETAIVRDFLELLRSSTLEQSKIIIANLHTKLDSVPRYDQFDDIPF